MSEKTKVNFGKQIFSKGMIYNSIAAVVEFMTLNCFVLLQPNQYPIAIVGLLIVLGVLEFGIAPFTHRAVMKKLPQKIADWKENGISTNSARTELFEEIMSFPTKKGIETLCFYVIGGILFCLVYHFVPQINIGWKNLGYGFFATLFGAFVAALFSVNYSEKICNKYARELIQEGLNTNYIINKKNFGITVQMRGVFFFIIPIILSFAMSFMILVQGYGEINGIIPTFLNQIARIIFINVICISCALWMPFNYWRVSIKSNEGLITSIEKMLNAYMSNVNSREFVMAKTNLNGKMQYNIYLLNEIIKQFKSILDVADNTGKNIFEIIENLSVIAKELSSTSLEQNSSVKEILSTMENENVMLQKIKEQTVGVASGTEITKEDVNEGDKILHENTAQIEFISDANKQIQKTIYELEQQVENIGAVVTMIKDIADQTRIIAFNAELEAVSAGDEGRNFHIVAAETRRLANSTMESINNIQGYIKSIQEATKDLIESSEKQTQNIQEEIEMTNMLVVHFNAIKETSEHTSKKAIEIASIVDQQSSSFNQIVITLRQIGAGIDSFTDSARTLSDATDNIRNVAKLLEEF